MNQRWSQWGAVVLVVAWAGLAARGGKDDLPEDLARVPATAKLACSVRLAELWGGEIGKEFREAMGKELAPFAEGFRSQYGVAPEEVERFTLVITDLERETDSTVTLLRTAKKFDPAKLLPDGRATSLSPDGKTLAVGGRAAVARLLEDKPAKPAGELAWMLAKAKEHHAAAFLAPAALRGRADGIPAALRPLLAAKNGVVWLDVGSPSRLGVRASFADEKAAREGREALDASLTLARSALTGSRFEKAIDAGKVEQRGAEVTAAFELPKDAIAALAKDARTALEKARAKDAEAMAAARVAVARARMGGANDLKQIGRALHKYHDDKGAFPAAATYDKNGKPLLSWRVAILPQLGQKGLYEQFKQDEPWDSEHNKKLLAKMPKVYEHQAARTTVAGGTFYQAFHGKGAAFEGKKGVPRTDFPDGAGSTVLVVEASKDVPWTKPEDVPFDPAGKLPRVGGAFDNGFNAVFADGSVRFISVAIKPDVLRAVITRNGGEKIE